MDEWIKFLDKNPSQRRVIDRKGTFLEGEKEKRFKRFLLSRKRWYSVNRFIRPYGNSNCSFHVPSLSLSHSVRQEIIADNPANGRDSNNDPSRCVSPGFTMPTKSNGDKRGSSRVRSSFDFVFSFSSTLAPALSSYLPNFWSHATFVHGLKGCIVIDDKKFWLSPPRNILFFHSTKTWRSSSPPLFLKSGKKGRGGGNSNRWLEINFKKAQFESFLRTNYVSFNVNFRF